jgi:hypothetical protein
MQIIKAVTPPIEIQPNKAKSRIRNFRATSSRSIIARRRPPGEATLPNAAFQRGSDEKTETARKDISDDNELR